MRRYSCLVLASAISLALTSGCGAQLETDPAAEIPVNAETLRTLPQGEKYIADLNSHGAYRFDFKDEPLDFERVEIAYQDKRISLQQWIETMNSITGRDLTKVVGRNLTIGRPGSSAGTFFAQRVQNPADIPADDGRGASGPIPGCLHGKTVMVHDCNPWKIHIDLKWHGSWIPDLEISFTYESCKDQNEQTCEW